MYRQALSECRTRKYENVLSRIQESIDDSQEEAATIDVIQIKKKENIEEFSKNSLSSKSVKTFAKRAKGVKTFNILANVGLSSFLLAYCLPKAQFAFRRLVTGSELEPGIVNANMEPQKFNRN